MKIRVDLGAGEFGTTIAQVTVNHEQGANADLIAAAPELLKVLKAIRDHLADKCDHGVLDRSLEYPLWIAAEAAIAIAEGK